MVITPKLSNEQLFASIHKAAIEYEKLLEKRFLIIGKNKNSDYFWFQCRFEKKNFMHLLGIRSKTLTANEFYDKAISKTGSDEESLCISDCTPSGNHNRTTINEKCSCCADMLRISDAKYMKVGSKDKISQFVDFSYAYGSSATLGFKRGEKDICFPVTLIPRNIDEFSTKKYKIIFVFSKQPDGPAYEEIVAERKKDILKDYYNDFPSALRELLKNPNE